MNRLSSLRVLASALLASLAMSGVSHAESIDTIIRDAQKEGKLTVMALNRDWCGYGDLIDGFTQTYGITVTDINPNAGSIDQIEALRLAAKDRRQPAPDVLDLDPLLAPMAKSEGLLATYKLLDRYADVPDAAKDPDFQWITAYYGVIGFQVSTDMVNLSPRDWPDLAAPEYVNMVALAGDPKITRQAWMAVYTAGIASNGGDAKTAVDAGLAFFKDLKVKGNLSPQIGRASAIEAGKTPIVLRWDYNALADKFLSGDKPPTQFILPGSGSVAGNYVVAINASADHPNAAKLWMEYLFSTQGQMAFLRAGCIPARFLAMAESGDIPADLLKLLPPVASYKKTIFMTPEQQIAARDAVAAGWDATVGIAVTP